MGDDNDDDYDNDDDGLYLTHGGVINPKIIAHFFQHCRSFDW